MPGRKIFQSISAICLAKGSSNTEGEENGRGEQEVDKKRECKVENFSSLN